MFAIELKNLNAFTKGECIAVEVIKIFGEATTAVESSASGQLSSVLGDHKPFGLIERLTISVWRKESIFARLPWKN